MKRLIAFISILMLVSSAYGTATSITIYGTNKSNAQSNITCYGCNQTISVQAWNTSYVKNISVHSRNGSGGDAVSFNISNVTAYQVQELKVNGTAINAYQAGANGMLNFTYTVVGNRTLVLSPARDASGYNFTWGRFWNTLPNISLPLSALNRSDANVFSANTSNISVVKQANGSYALDTTKGAVSGSGYTKQAISACVKTTVAQNTNSSSLLVSFSYLFANANSFTVKTDAVNPPTTTVLTGSGLSGNAVEQQATFIVLPSNYYVIDTNVGSDALLGCTSWS